MAENSAKIEAMHEAHGTKDGFCKDCCNFSFGIYPGATIRKCIGYGADFTKATNWDGGWTACGLYNVPFKGDVERPLIEKLRHLQRQRKEGTASDGQLKWSDLFY